MLMNLITVTDWIGYLAMFLVVSSFIFSDVKKLRIVNLLGAAAFISYGYMIGAIPIIITNTVIITIQVYHLFKTKKVSNE